MVKVLHTWKTPRLTKLDVYALLFSLTFQGVIRAWAYTGVDDGGDVLSLVEVTMPLKYWGYILFVFLGVLALGVALSNHLLIWLGHSFNSLIYLVLLFGIILNVFTGDSNIGQALIYVSLLINPLVLHTILFIRMGPDPVSEGNSVPVESVVGDNGNL